MKTPKLLTVAFCLFFMGIITTQAQSIFDKWPQLNDFHEVMSQTYHPSEEGDLDPIRTRIDEMVKKANTLNDSEAPKEFQTPEIAAAQKKLVSGSESLQDLIADDADDEKVTAVLEALHDVFHEIVGLCKEHND